VQSRSSPAAIRLRPPPLKALLAFEAVSRHATFAQGAEELGVTPSAVSHQIQQLEDFLGVRLFRREAGRAALTNAGRVYAQEIGRAFALISNATNLVAPQTRSGNLVIASSPSFATKWLQPRLPDFLSACPGIKVRLFSFFASEGFENVRCDVAVTYGRPQAVQNHSEPLLTEIFRPLCSPKLVSALRLQTPRDLSCATLIHSINALTWSEYFGRIGESELRPQNELWLNPSSLAIDAAVAGLGVILESELLAAQEIADGRLVAPFAQERFGVATESYFLVRPAGSRNATQVGRFEDWLRRAMGSSRRVEHA
jgi:LysR family glycine cleavage system transcriptional activator